MLRCRVNDSTAMNDAPASKGTKHGGGGRAFYSRLEPFVDFIREQRQRRKTWKEIADLLQTEKGCSITFQGVHQFYRRYVKRQARPHWERDAVIVARLPAGVSGKPVIAATPPARPYRTPHPDSIKLNDPTKI